MPPLSAEILAVGTELLLGEIVDTNSAYIAGRLRILAIDCFHVAHVGDNLVRVTQAIEQALARSRLLIITGGLGPTEDDLTREAIAQVLGETPVVDAALDRELRDWFARRGFPMPERNQKQAWLIPSAIAIPNSQGTAPGWWVRRDQREVIAMPGVPREMTTMWEDYVEPKLVARSGGHLAVRTLKLLGIGESAVEERLGDLVRATFPTVATYAKSDGVHVRIAAKAPDSAAAAGAVAEVERVVRERLGQHIWGVDAERLHSVVGERLRARGWRLAVHETLTAGAISMTLCEQGVPDWFAGAVVIDGELPQAEVTLRVDGDSERATVRARTPVRDLQLEVRHGSVVEGRRRAALMGLEALRRVLADDEGAAD
jgi:nicotinamide-nucleotide amidase